MKRPRSSSKLYNLMLCRAQTSYKHHEAIRPRLTSAPAHARRLVVHYNLPKTLEGFYQESGRAGRDGAPAASYMFYGLADRRCAEFLLQKAAQQKDKGGSGGSSRFGGGACAWGGLPAMQR